MLCSRCVYINIVVHESFADVVEYGLLGDLGQQDHVVIAALFDILRHPVVADLCATSFCSHLFIH